MIFDRKAVQKVAHLARIEITDKHADSLAVDLSNIMEWVEQLSEVDTDKVAPMTSPVEIVLHQRKDNVNDGNIREDLMKNAPEQASGFFVVPKMVE